MKPHPHNDLIYSISADHAHAIGVLEAIKWAFPHLPPASQHLVGPLGDALIGIDADLTAVQTEIVTTKRPRPAALTQAAELRVELADRLRDLETTIIDAGKVSR